jgi:TIR domain
MSGAPQFFISYDETYRNAAAALHERLLRELRGTFGRDIDIFLDHRDIAGGDAWRQQIEDGLKSANVLIALVNDAFVTRPYCRYEFDTVRQRRDGGEACRIVTVRFQGDSEIYRVSTDSASRIQEADRQYLASLDDDARAAVNELREIQAIDGVALREAAPDSGDYNAALFRLSRTVAQQYREVRGGQAHGEGGAAATGEGAAPKPKFPTTAVLAVLAVLVVGVAATEFAIPPTQGWISRLFAGGGDEPVVVVPEGPTWKPSGLAVLTNKGSEIAIAYREGADGADIANAVDQIQPGTERPEAGVPGDILQACIEGERWLKYPVPGPAEALVSAASLGMTPEC